MNDDKKVFINICQHEDIDIPGVKKRLNDAGEEIEGMNIPMSVGAPREEFDKSNHSCRVYDIIVNPVVLTEAENDKTGQYRDFVCQLGIQCLEHKYKDIVDKRYKLPKLKYMGEKVLSQYIQDRKKMPKIDEIKSSKEEKKANITVQKSKPVEIVEKDLPFQLNYIRHTAESACPPSIANILCHTENFTKEGINIEPNEYMEPTASPDPSVQAILLSAEISNVSEDLLSSAAVSISPYRIQVKLYGFKKLLIYLPAAVCPAEAAYSFSRPYEGFVSKVEFRLAAPLDRLPWESAADFGSKIWLVSEALNNTEENGQEGTNPYSRSIGNTDMKIEEKMDKKDDEDVLAEDKFHLKLPKDVDPYTGMKMEGTPLEPDDGAGEELPEDRFHKKDASSSYLIQQREQAKKDKWDNFEK